MSSIGNSQPTSLNYYLEALEGALGRKADRDLLPMKPADVPATPAEPDVLHAWVDLNPPTPVRDGVRRSME